MQIEELWSDFERRTKRAKESFESELNDKVQDFEWKLSRVKSDAYEETSL